MAMTARREMSAVLAMVAALCATAVALGQSTSVDDLGAGKLLVAARDLGDPSFAQSVVLLVQYDRQGTVGLMINRRTKLPLSDVLKDLDTAKRGSDPIYLGGPVELDGVMALLRSAKKPDDAKAVFGDVYLVSSKDSLVKALGASASAGDLRLYLGYCGWDRGQLENEVGLGGWWIFDGTPGVVFDSNPDTVWSRFITRTEQEVAEARPVRVAFPAGLAATLPATRPRAGSVR